MSAPQYSPLILIHQEEVGMCEKPAAEVYEEGYLAHMDGYPESDNPYSCDRNEDIIWLAGHRASAAEHVEELARAEAGNHAR
ncbi:TPA: hypothetical protein QDB04_002911 [Burkholderia vietnamiensis]|jgi:hypothetical protein|nr:hypothetical protein [Burkholderia vietnamiensis]